MGRGLTGVVALPQARPELRKPARSVPQSYKHDMANSYGGFDLRHPKLVWLKL